MMASLLHRESQAGGSISSSNKKTRKKFGATTPPFIDYLKEILRRYPDGGQILKELIQNADDAEAKEVVFLFDERTYGTTSVFMKDLKKFQGPALVVYNDSVFSEEDWHSIQTTGISKKRNDPSKVGQFGLGFNTVYHITDLPSIFSGKYIGIFDPQEKLFGEQEAGYIWSLDDPEDKKALEHSRDQFRPFRYAMEATGTITWTNALKEHYFKGTLFRFPLRTEPSEILDNLYDKAKIFDLFDSFRADEDMSLLFLRNVISVCIKHIDTSGNLAVLLEVTAFQPEHVPSFNHNLNVERQQLVFNVKSCTYIRAISHRVATEEHHNHWLITNCTGKIGKWANLDDLAERLSYTPYVGLAFLLSKAETIETDARTDFEGRLSFFLPLPNNEANKTGLPIHINAFFGLSDNRRHIKWIESDQRYDDAAKWNELLIEKIFPCAYCQLILDAITLAQKAVLKPSSVYHLWPDLEKMNRKERWIKITKETIKRLLGLNVLCLAACEQKWIRADKAIFLQCHDRLDIRQAIENLLIREAQPLVRVPHHVFKTILFTLENQSHLNVVTPASLRNILQHCNLDTTPYEQKLKLLEYVLSDDQYSSLNHLQLLPVSGGAFVKFQISPSDDPVFTDSAKFPRILLPSLERSFLPEDLSDALQQHLKKMAHNQIFSNLICLDVGAVKQQIRKALPDNWTKKLGRVTWDITNSQHPPVQWLAQFWDFLNKNCKTLDKFEGLPLIPLNSLKDSTNSLQLAHLSKNITTIFQMQNGYKLPDTISSIITRAGGSVVRNSDEFLKHPQLAEYVFVPNPNNILKLFLNLGCDQVVKEIGSMSIEDRRSLRDFLAEASIFDTDEINMLFKLPIFEQMMSLGSTNKGLIPAGTHGALSNDVYPEIPDDMPLPETVLKCVDEKDRKLMLMKGKLLTAADIALLMLKGVETQKYEPEQIEKVMLWILKNSEILFKQKPELFNKCKTLKFLTLKDKVVQTSVLFDPHNVTFQHLFQPECQHLFPPSLYCMDEKVLLTLQKLGLKSKDDSISPDDLLKVARLIDRQHSQASDIDNILKKAEALIKVCNTTSVLAICSYQTVEQLLSLHWVPCNSPPKISTESKKISIDFHKPENVRDSKFANIIGLMMPLTDKFTEKASKILGLLNLPPPKKVIENLLFIIHQVCTNRNLQCSFLTDLQNIYEYMQKHLSQFKVLLLAIEQPWVWNGTGFAYPQQIVFSYPENLDLRCYVKRVPQEISQYRELLTECGVKAGYSDDETIQILYSIKDNTVKLNSGYGSPSELKTVISILDWMRRNNLSFNNDLPVPVWKGTQGGFCLKPCSKTVFCDLDKGTLEDINKNENIYVVHKEVSLAIVEWLNVPPLSSKVLNPELIGIEQYGQVEPIVLRIKNILKEYDQEHDLFKELLQNAEDAGSTVCSFLVDMRQHKDSPESLIDPGMAACHGPALWSYNNECFTDDDFHNITRIGTGSKENQIDKIGKFGLGFNSVYHITDVPSILSGKYLLIFDPNVTHLGKHIHSVSNPGIKLNLYEHKQLIQRFPGQFNPYNGIFGCNFKNATGENFYYEGTLIKLPFRTPEEAAVSGLSNKYYNQKHIMTLVDSFKQMSKDLVIFLKNVRKVSLKFISEHSAHENQIISVFKMERQVLNIIEMADNFPIKKMQQNAVDMLESTIKFSGKIRSLSTSTIIQFMEEMIDNPSQIKYWLVHSCFGMAKALQIACSKTASAYFAPPLGSVAIPLKKKKETGHWMPNTEAHVGQVFCFLPLSLQCGLPVQINGSFAVTSNRKNLWSSGPKGDWNQALLEDAVSTAYVTSISLMQQMSQKGEFENYDYYTFWPNVKNVDNQFRVIVENFYKAVAHGLNGVTVKAFSNGKDWCPINQARFLDSPILKNKRVGESAVSEFSKFLSKPFISVHLPEWVKQSFIACGCGHSIEQNTYNWELFYKEIVFKNINVLNTKTRNDFIINAIDMRNSSIDEMLRIKQCMPASGKEDLQYIKNLVHPEGKLACLYDEEDGRFLVGTPEDFLHPERLLRLEMLGMVKDKIAFPALLERAETIKQTWDLDRNKAYQRVRHILDLLKDQIQLNDDEQQSLQNVPFLPAFLPHCQENNGPIDTIVLTKAKDLYSCKCQSLVNMTEMVLDKELLKGNKLSTEAVSFLGLNRQPPVGTVLEQLKYTYTCNNLTTCDLKRITKECYIYLTKQLKGDPESKREIYNAAQEFPFILAHGHFVPVKLVARKVSFDVVPYLYELPKEFVECEELWKCLEIKEQFQLQDYVSVLKRMSEKYHGERLSDSDLAVCLRIVTTGFIEAPEQEDILQSVLLPNQHCILHSAQTLQYNDTPWLVGDDVNLCHNQIARETAVRFHVQTTKHRAMKNLQVKDMSIWAQEFGQQEKLTVRLKNIIKAYPAKKDILKELIQNADDAEASEIHFIWDPRKHGNTKTFGEEWNTLQGPALCVYNNKRFTDKDIEGIQQLGEGGKRNSPEKTGKYGLGFNSVYHLTDCPSFMSGDSMLCIFDPHLAVLATAKPHSPGGMFIVNQKFKNTFEDIYTTFLPSFFNLELGTMFRLPLRTAEMVEKSDISKQAVTKDVILELLEVLKEDSDSLLLFLNNIKKISFHKIDKRTNELQEIFAAVVEMSQENVSEQEHLKNYIRQHSSSTTTVSKMESHQAIYEMEIRSSFKQPTTWILANKVGVDNGETTESVQTFCSNLGQILLPRGSVAACIGCNCFQGKAFCFLPLPIETGLPVHINGNFAVDFARRDLWKQDGQSGKMKWNNFLKLHLIAPLYADLLDYIRKSLSGSKVGPLTFNSLELCKQSIEPHYLWFFPHVSEEVPQEWQLMINQVYRCICQKRLCLIPIVRHESNQFHCEKIINITWSSLTKEKRAEVPHFVTVHITGKLIEILEDIGINLVLQSDYMTKVLKGLERACMDVFVLNPNTVRKFLQIHPLNNPEQTKNSHPLPLSQSLIKDGARCMALLDYCLSDVKEGNYNNINNLPLLVTQSNMLGKFKRASPKYISKFHDLFPESQMCFANYDVHKKHKYFLIAAGFLEDFTISRAEQFIRIKLGYKFQINSTDPHQWLNWTENEQFVEWLKKLWKYFESQIKYDDDKENMTDKLKLLFSDLAILPVLCPSYNDDQHLLAPLGSLNSVICEMTQTSVARILLKLGFAKIAADYFSLKVMFNFIRPNSLKTDDKNSILQHLRLTKLHWNNLSEWEMETILRFLHSGMETSDDKHKYQEQLKTLPLFETMEETFECIEMYNVIYILNTQFSDTFPHLYKLDSSCMFLKKTRINTELSEDLGIQVIDDLQFFMDYIVPNIEQIFNDQKLDVIRLLYNIICCYITAYEMKKEQIVPYLENVKLIKAKDGIFQKISYFYENSGRLFKIMIPAENFVPDNFFTDMGCHFEDSNLNKLLKDLGLKCSVSSDDFVAFASQVSEEVKRHHPLKELIEKSDALVTYLCSIDEESLQKNFYEKVANIKFIYPHKVRESLRNLHSPYAEGRSFVALKDSLVKQRDEDEELVWTSMPILPTKCSQSRSNINKLKAAGAIYNPPENVVIANLRKVCLAPCKSQSVLKTRSKVLQTAYGFLQKHSFEVQALIDLPIVLVEEDSKLVKINQVVFSLQNYLEFRPYLYRLPPLLAPYREFFQKLDVALEPSASHLTQVLRSLYEDCSKMISLNQNQMTTVKRTLYNLFTLLESKVEERIIEKLKPLYLPASDSILYASDTICFNDRITTGSRRDANALKGKFNFLLDLGECYLNPDPYKQINLLQFLPEEIRPKMLSQLTEEILNESVLRLCPYGNNCMFRNDFHKLLVSSSFRVGLVSLLKGQCSDIERSCENVFSKMQIICCEKLETILCLGSKQLSNTSIEKQVYTKMNNMGSGVVYLEHRDNVPFSMKTVIIHSLATEINLLLKNALNKDSLLILVLMLSCENPQDIQKVLEGKGIHTGNFNIEISLDLPNPGEPIPEELIHTLEMDIMHNFRVGEYVGYKGPSSNDYLYAIFIERLSTDTCIKDIRMQKYKIKIGQDSFIVVNHLDLYKFTQQKVPEEVCQNLVALDIPKDKQAFSQKYESFDNIKKEIQEYLKEIRNLPKDDRQKAIRRLYLKWHPDKNPNNIEVTTKLCHFIQEKVKQLDIIQADNGSSSSAYTSSFSSKEEDFSSFFNQWNSEASRHKQSQSQQKKNQSANEFWSFPKQSQSNPEEAQRWFRQAKCDLKAASNDLRSTDCTATEWLYFKIHQAVEKALIAAEYINSGKWESDHSITFLASQVSRYSTKLSELENMVNKLKEHGVDSKKTQYPNYHSQPHVPNDQFKAGHEHEVLNLAQTVLDNIEEYIMSNS
ncbi:sacsin isoform X1 [Scyliorhinus torazame]